MTLRVRYYMTWFKRHVRCFRFLVFFSFLLLFFSLAKLYSAGTRNLSVQPVNSASKLKATTLRTLIHLNPERLKQTVINKRHNNLLAEKNKAEMKIKWLKEKIEKLNRIRSKPEIFHVEVNKTIPVNYNVHIFYYAWYESEAFDGSWQHWNHEYIKSWKKNDPRDYPTGRHSPPDDIGSNFYPKLGCYSSRDPKVVAEHMKMIRNAGIGVIIVSWYPPGMSDGPFRSPDTVFAQLLNAAQKEQLKVSPHIEPYKDRNPQNFLQYLKYFKKTYGNHPALYKISREGKDLIVYYIYDSYRTPALAWRELLSTAGRISVRGTPDDGIFLGLLVDAGHKYEIRRGRFDGFYTYFATNGFSYGSTWKNWKTLSSLARNQNLIFVPSIGPGYIDTRVRPWNIANARHRRHGKYYEVGWRTSFGAEAKYISITSFNEWHEGTQIEPAVPKTTQNYTYLDYEPEGSDFYLNLTKFWVNEFSKK